MRQETWNVKIMIKSHPAGLITRSFWTFYNWPMHCNGQRFIFYQSFRDMRWTIHSYQQYSQYFNQLSQYLVCVRIIYNLDRSTFFVAWETQLHDHNLQFSLLTKSTVFGGPPILISNSMPCYGFGCRGFSNLTSDESTKNVKQKIVLWQLE